MSTKYSYNQQKKDAGKGIKAFYWIDRFGPDSFEIFREDLGPDEEESDEDADL